MIKIKVIENEIVIIGHAGYDIEGKDIVCASVSSILTTTVNALVRYDKQCINYTPGDDFKIVVLKHDEVIDLLITNMLDLFKELEKQYPKYIRRC